MENNEIWTILRMFFKYQILVCSKMEDGLSVSAMISDDLPGSNSMANGPVPHLVPTYAL